MKKRVRVSSVKPRSVEIRPNEGKSFVSIPINAHAIAVKRSVNTELNEKAASCSSASIGDLD